MRRSRRYPRDLPRALKEKVATLSTAAYFADRRARADFAAFDKIMRRRRGEPPRKGDEPRG